MWHESTIILATADFFFRLAEEVLANACKSSTEQERNFGTLLLCVG